MIVILLASFTLIIITFLIYCIVPTYYYKFFKTKELKKLGNNNDILLTFDDGVDEVYTEKLLDLLKQHEIKAAFFCCGY